MNPVLPVLMSPSVKSSCPSHASSRGCALTWQGIKATMRSLNDIVAYFGGALAAGVPCLLDPGNCLGLENGVSYLALSRRVFTGALPSCSHKDGIANGSGVLGAVQTFTTSKSSIILLPALFLVAKTIRSDVQQDVNQALQLQPFSYIQLATGVQALCDGLALMPLHPTANSDGEPTAMSSSSSRSNDATGGEAQSHPHTQGSRAGASNTPSAVLGVIAMHGTSCLWSSLERDDTSALVALATSALLPHATVQPSAWKMLKGAALATAGRCAGVFWICA